MKATLVKETLVYFLAEAPGKFEDQSSGRPLTGPSGQLLRSAIPDDMEGVCSFDNVVNCRPSDDNRTPTPVEMACCSSRRTTFVEQAKPKVIVGLGAVPLNWMLGSTDLKGMRGRPFAVRIGSHNCWFLPTYHPAFILRQADRGKVPLKSKLGHCLKMDIARAFEIAETWPNANVDDPETVRDGIECFHGKNGQFDRLISLLEEATLAPFKVIDLETNCLCPYQNGHKILSMAIGYGPLTPNVFSFAFEHPDSGWNVNEKVTLNRLMIRLLKGGTTKIAHNVPFEVEWLAATYGILSTRCASWEDTMVQAHILDERRGAQHGSGDNHRNAYQDLGFLCKQHFGVDVKKLFKLDKKHMEKTDLDELLIYNGVDAKYELRLYVKQQRLIRQAGLEHAYKDASPRQQTVALMQYIGMPVDQVEVKRAQKQLGDGITELETDISTLPVVKQFVADHGEFNPQSNTQTLEIFRDYLKRGEVCINQQYHEVHTFDVSTRSKRKFDESGKTSRYSVDKNVLEKIDHPLAKLILKLRNLAKLKSTYIDSFESGKGNCIWDDGLIHTSFNTTFTETGRTSSDAPNMQNFPKRNDAWVRRQIVAPKNCVILAADYGQLEACVAAMCSKDEYLVKALWEDYDIHMEWAEKLVAIYPDIVGGREAMKDPKTRKAFRSRVKNKMVFPAIFGATAASIASYLNMPVDIIEIILDEFWEAFHGLHRWQDVTMRGYYENGYVETPNGRRRRYPLTRNQAINHPIQGGAAEIVCDAMNRLSWKATHAGSLYLHPRLNIHDDLTLIVPSSPEHLDEAIVQLYTTMLTSPYKFINVPMSVEISVGKNWYEMQEVGKFWSHRDL